jgi:hypothetical protein
MKTFALSVLLCATFVGAGCYGPHTVYYIDSAREPGSKTHDHDLDTPRVQHQKCGKSGVAKIETYTSWFDQLMSYMTWSEADRSVEITCAKER